MRTVSVALVLCLNVGVDPPDVVKTNPCARMECWIGKSEVITVEERLFRVFSAYSAENTLKSLSSTVMTGRYFKPCKSSLILLQDIVQWDTYCKFLL